MGTGTVSTALLDSFIFSLSHAFRDRRTFVLHPRCMMLVGPSPWFVLFLAESFLSDRGSCAIESVEKESMQMQMG